MKARTVLVQPGNPALKEDSEEKKRNDNGTTETSSANGSATESSAEYNDITPCKKAMHLIVAYLFLQ